jgi:hypothetical protein
VSEGLSAGEVEAVEVSSTSNTGLRMVGPVRGGMAVARVAAMVLDVFGAS